jgi:hypothetical protein
MFANVIASIARGTVENLKHPTDKQIPQAEVLLSYILTPRRLNKMARKNNRLAKRKCFKVCNAAKFRLFVKLMRNLYILIQSIIRVDHSVEKMKMQT